MKYWNNMIEYNIQDNYLDEETYSNIKNIIMSQEKFSWFFSASQNGYANQEEQGLDTFYFYHVLFSTASINSPFFDYFVPLFTKMKINALINARLNLVTNTYGNGYNAKHIDKYSHNLDHKIAIFHFTTNNGMTVLCSEDKEEKIETVENRLIKFNGDTEHYSVHQTDANRRVILNINYY